MHQNGQVDMRQSIHSINKKTGHIQDEFSAPKWYPHSHFNKQRKRCIKSFDKNSFKGIHCELRMGYDRLSQRGYQYMQREMRKKWI
jgi:hypothetical protein